MTGNPVSSDILGFYISELGADSPAIEAGNIASRRMSEQEIKSHPLYQVFMMCIEQAAKGKGSLHGGDVEPFMTQPWAHYAKLHGRGFLTGQAAKKLEEAASTRSGDAFIKEMRGAIVYAAMAIIYEERKNEI